MQPPDGIDSGEDALNLTDLTPGSQMRPADVAPRVSETS